MKKSCNICRYLDISIVDASFNNNLFKLQLYYCTAFDKIKDPPAKPVDYEYLEEAQLKILKPDNFYCSLFKIRRKKDE